MERPCRFGGAFSFGAFRKRLSGQFESEAKFIRKIPIAQSVYDNPHEAELTYEVWDRTHLMVFSPCRNELAEAILYHYSYGYYLGEVLNGGHSQLVHNMDIAEKRSPFLFDSARAGAKQIGANGLGEIVSDLETWMLENPEIAAAQTGFEGGRAEFLDDLDERFAELHDAYSDQLANLLHTSTHQRERAFLEDCVGRRGQWHSDLEALELSWLLRGPILEPMPDTEEKIAWQRVQVRCGFH